MEINDWGPLAQRIIKLYKKTEIGEELIAIFPSRSIASLYSSQNKTMNSGWLKRSIDENRYPYCARSTTYPDTNNYRFEAHHSPVLDVRIYLIKIKGSDKTILNLWPTLSRK